MTPWTGVAEQGGHRPTSACGAAVAGRRDDAPAATEASPGCRPARARSPRRATSPDRASVGGGRRGRRAARRAGSPRGLPRAARPTWPPARTRHAHDPSRDSGGAADRRVLRAARGARRRQHGRRRLLPGRRAAYGRATTARRRPPSTLPIARRRTPPPSTTRRAPGSSPRSAARGRCLPRALRGAGADRRAVQRRAAPPGPARGSPGRVAVEGAPRRASRWPTWMAPTRRSPSTCHRASTASGAGAHGATRLRRARAFAASAARGVRRGGARLWARGPRAARAPSPETATPAPHRRGRRWGPNRMFVGGWAAIGTGAAALGGVAVALGLAALDARDEFQRRQTRSPRPGRQPPHRRNVAVATALASAPPG